MIQQFFNRPGVHTSEFSVLLATVIWNIIDIAGNYVAQSTSLRDITLPAVAYAVARGLAKTETQGSGGSGA